MCKILIAALCLLTIPTAVSAAETRTLIDPTNPAEGWAFGNGPEFPGAVGELTADGQALRLHGDFNKGGKYVQAARSTGRQKVNVVSFEVRAPGRSAVALRLVEAGGECHQFRLRIEDSNEWQRIVFPVQRFFERRGTPDAVRGVTGYQHWGNEKNGQLDSPVTSFVILAGPSADKRTGTLWLRDVRLDVAGAEAEPAELKTEATSTIAWRRVPMARGWQRGLGEEFPGAKGEMTVLPDGGPDGGVALRLDTDFTGGGAYAEVRRPLHAEPLRSFETLRLRMRSDNVTRFSLRVGDETGQTHQAGGFAFTPDGKWQTIEVPVDRIVGRESWGGAKDRKWHGAPRYLAILIGPSSTKDRKPSFEIAAVELEGDLPGGNAEEFVADFEAADALAEWQIAGDVTRTDAETFAGEGALLIERTESNVNVKTYARSRVFNAAPGLWQVEAAIRSDLVSPDNSFAVNVRFEALDARGQVLRGHTLATVYGRNGWRALSETVSLPRGTVGARYVLTMSKATGAFQADGLRARFLAEEDPDANPVERWVIRHERLGNLLYPEDDRVLSVRVQAHQPLTSEQRVATYVVRDYWGVDQGQARTAELEPDGQTDKGLWVYETTFDLDGYPNEIGRYYEVHASLPRRDGGVASDFRSYAILPEAVANQYPWREIPFTSRNWDNRIREYVLLTNRLGVRVAGVWSGWSAKPPYKPHAPLAEMIRDLDMGVLFGTPVGWIEHKRHNWQDYTEEVLRKGVARMIEKYGGDHMMIFLGNEPRGGEENARRNTAAYRIMYEAVKEIDPDIFVLGSSIGPIEDYFVEGAHQWCDAVDFHTYESPDNITRLFDRYDELFEKYGHRKPIWSTEIGLNSQGMTRRTVANTLIRKFALFFAEGGENISWFTIQYPDPSGRSSGSAGDSHNTFDARYRVHSPRLDAIAYYNMVNAIAIKDFAEQREYDGVHAVRFEDVESRQLVVLWADGGDRDVFVPLSGLDTVTVTYLDGAIREFDTRGEGLTLRLTADPVILQGVGGASLPDALADPRIVVADPPAAAVQGNAVVFHVVDAAPDTLTIEAPPMWDVTREATDNGVRFTVAAPLETRARHVPIAIRRETGEAATAELRYLLPVQGRLESQLYAATTDEGAPAVRLVIRNNGQQNQLVDWSLSVDGEVRQQKGKFNTNNVTETGAHFAATADGKATVLSMDTAEVVVPLSSTDPKTIYRVSSLVVEGDGRRLEQSRFVAGFLPARRSETRVTLDGVLDEPVWQATAERSIAGPDMVYSLGQGPDIKGDADLSGAIRVAWDDEYLYLAVVVTDDVWVGNARAMWQQDGLQLLIDPARSQREPAGKYDYGIGLTAEGPVSEVYLDADPGAPLGRIDDFMVAVTRHKDGTGGRTYEVAIPWERVKPFRVIPGENLGLHLAINEDDGEGRHGWLAWFGDVQSKQATAVADIILLP